MTSSDSAYEPPRPRFEWVAGRPQPRFESIDDFRALNQLSDTDWMATCAPVRQLGSEEALYEALDDHGNGRVLSSSIRRYVQWILAVLTDAEAVERRESVLDLKHLDESHQDGPRLRAAALRVLKKDPSHAEQSCITLEAVQKELERLKSFPENSDGLVELDEVRHQPLKRLMSAALDCEGTDGEDKGVNLDTVRVFLGKVRSALKHAEGARDFRDKILTDSPWGERTREAWTSFQKVAEHLDAYFQICALVRFRAGLGADPMPTEMEAPPLDCPGKIHDFLSNSPLAPPNSEEIFRFSDDLNPLLRDALTEFQEVVLSPLGQGENLTSKEWKALKSRFRHYGDRFETEVPDLLRRHEVAELEAFLEEDLLVRLERITLDEAEAAARSQDLADLQVLLLLQKHILEICANFVTFSSLLDPQRRALFEVGSMTMDGRIFNVNLLVEDVEAHARVAAKSGIFLFYSELLGAAENKPRYVVTPVISGSPGNIAPGRLGTFVDFSGRQWEALVVWVEANPVSVLEIVLGPYRRLGETFSGALERFTRGAEEQMHSNVDDKLANVEKRFKDVAVDPSGNLPVPPKTKPPASPSNFLGGGPGNLLLMGSAGISMLGATFAYVMDTLDNLRLDKALAVMGILLLFLIVPATLIAWFRLRGRKLAPLLEGSGWVMNDPLKLAKLRARKLRTRPARSGLPLWTRSPILRMFHR